MNWLMDNPIANMYGPHFLLLYGIVIVLTLVICCWLLRNRTELSPSYHETSTADVVENGESGDWLIRLAGALVILGLGSYKLLVALANGRHNVGFMIIMSVVALCILFGSLSKGVNR